MGIDFCGVAWYDFFEVRTIEFFAKAEHLNLPDARLFTAVFLPREGGVFPTVILRTPYLSAQAELSEADLLQEKLCDFDAWLSRGYAVVFQHCRGRGRSTGEFIPYLFEREDGLALRRWIREQDFYNGELYLYGASYTASLHYATAPFEPDVKGAVFEVQDLERYRLWYRNGQMRKGHANWHFALCRRQDAPPKNFSMDSFAERPLLGLSERALGYRLEDFEQMLLAPRPTDPFWDTRFGGAEARHATDAANIPILFTTGYNDFYVGGMFRMWDRLNGETKRQSALLVSPYNHGDTYPASGLSFPQGARREAFGATYPIDWFDHIRHGTPLPYRTGEITYYRLFENRWQGDFHARPTQPLTLRLGRGDATFVYDPQNPPAFPEEGVVQTEAPAQPDRLCLITPPLEQDVFIKGAMTATLAVRTNVPDTSVYLSVSIRKPQGDYRLRHDVTSIGYQIGAYTPGREISLSFRFDEHAFLLKKGESLRLDIAATDDNTYVSHTNRPGAYARQSTTAVATTTVVLDRSTLTLPVEESDVSSFL